MTIVVSHSEIDTYRQCRLKHQIAYIERWRGSDEAEALSRGTLFHSVMEAHYRALKEAGKDIDSEALYAAVAHHLYDRETGTQTERQELVEWIYRGYVECYKLDPYWEILDVELPLRVTIPDEDGKDSGFELAGTCDLLVRDHQKGGGLWIVDHKTCKNLPKQKDFDMEDQTGMYTFLLKEKSGLDIRGAIYNHCRTYRLQRPMHLDERFKRTPTVRTDQELRTMTLEALNLMREAYDRITLMGDRVFDAPRSPDGERCGWKCDLTEACLAGRKSGPQRTRQFLKDLGFEQKDTKPGPTFAKKRVDAAE